eukprot:gene15146-22019_t
MPPRPAQASDVPMSSSSESCETVASTTLTLSCSRIKDEIGPKVHRNGNDHVVIWSRIGAD